jgi:hypothetical protein
LWLLFVMQAGRLLLDAPSVAGSDRRVALSMPWCRVGQTLSLGLELPILWEMVLELGLNRRLRSCLSLATAAAQAIPNMCD